MKKDSENIPTQVNISNTDKSFMDLFLDISVEGWYNFFQSLIRFIFLLSVLFIFGICGVKKFKTEFPSSKLEKIELLGSVMSFSSQEKTFYTYQFSTNTIWDTLSNVHFQKGDKLKIMASGKYNPAIHHLVDYSKTDTGKIFEWIGTTGIPKNQLEDADSIRAEKCIYYGKNYGALLVKLVFDRQKGEKTYVFESPNLETGLEIEFNENGGYLAFAVNEPILSVIDSTTYVINNSEYCKRRCQECTMDSCLKSQNQIWQQLIRDANQLKQLWFDDNIGQFLIVIEKKQN